MLNRREFIQHFAAGSLSLRAAPLFTGLLGEAVLAGDDELPQPAKPPNVVFFMTDDQSCEWVPWGHLAKAGLRHEYPHLRRLADAGMVFNRYYCPASVCSPSRAGHLTGRHPGRYGNCCWGDTLPVHEQTLAKVLKGGGYRTAHVGKWHLGGLPWFPGDYPTKSDVALDGRPDNFSPAAQDRSMRPLRLLEHPGNHGFGYWFSHRNVFNADPRGFVRNGEPVGRLTGRGTPLILDEALAFLRRCATEEAPFLLVVWTADPHWPGNTAVEVKDIDVAVGKIREALRTLGMEQNTMLWFCGDNGHSKGRVLESGIRTPAVVEWPGVIPAGSVCDQPVSGLDLMATLCSLTDRGTEAHLDGADLCSRIVEEVP